MLVIDQSKRLTCEQALEHPYFAEHHNPENEPTCYIFNMSRETEIVDALDKKGDNILLEKNRCSNNLYFSLLIYIDIFWEKIQPLLGKLFQF